MANAPPILATYSKGASSLTLSPPDGERREVSVLFADLVGSTELGETIGDEAIYAMTRQLFARLVEMIEARGGRLAEFSGDGLMVLFGGPVAVDEAPLVACRAGLEVLRILGSWRPPDLVLPTPLRMRLGITTGMAVVGKVGLPTKLDLTAIGDIVNLAAGLQGAAGPGEVWIDERTHALAAAFIEAVPLGPVIVKGRKERVLAYRLNRAREGLSRFEATHGRSPPPLIGRHAELELLESEFVRSETEPRLIGIVGEAGIGKSRLVAEALRADRQGVRVLIGNCAPDARYSPYAPIIDVIRQAIGIGEETDTGTIAAAVSTAIGAAAGSANESSAIIAGLLTKTAPDSGSLLPGLMLKDILFEFIEEWRRRTRSILLFEDVHWIDQTSLELVERLAARAASPGLVIWTSRDRAIDGGQAHAATIRLSGLADSETERLVGATLGAAALPQGLTRFVARRSGGNPLFAKAMARFLEERGDIRRTPNGMLFTPTEDDALPPTIQNLIMQRVDRLQRDTKLVLQAAAIVGQRFPAAVLAEVLGQSAMVVETALMGLCDDGLLTPSDGGFFAFQHALVRDSLYHSLLDIDRRAIHQRVAKAIEEGMSEAGRTDAAVLAYHYTRSNSPAKAVQYLIAAGENALSNYALDDADRAFRLASERITADPALADQARRGSLLANWMRVLELQGRFREIRELAERYLSSPSAAAPSPEAISIRVHCAHALGHAHRFAEATREARRALEEAQAAADLVRAAEARLILVKILSKTRIGNQDTELQEIGHLILDVARTLPDAYLELVTLFELANARMHCGAIVDARSRIAELIKVGEERGDPRAKAFALWMIGWLDLQEGNYSEALRNAEESLAVTLTRTDALVAMTVKGAAIALLDNPKKGAELLRAVRSEAEANQDFNIVSAVDSALGVALALAGQIGHGVKLIRRSIRRGERTGYLTSAAYGRLVLGEVYAKLAQREAATDLRVILRNLPFLIWAIPVASWRARRLLKRVLDSRQFIYDSIVSVRINLALGAMAGRKNGRDARALLTEAERISHVVGTRVMSGRIREALGRVPG